MAKTKQEKLDLKAEKLYYKTHKKKTKFTVGDVIFNILNYAFFGIFTLSCIFPFYYLFINTISDNSLVRIGAINFIPKGLHLQNYISLLKADEILDAFMVSASRTVIGTALMVMVSALAGYLMTKQEMWHRKIWYRFLVITMYFNAGLVPSYLNLLMLGLTENYLVYIIPAIVQPYNIILVKTYIESIPAELEESAFIDGASHMKIFRNIIWPLSKPILATIAIFGAVGHWNSFMDSILYMSGTPELQTLQHRLYIYLNQTTSLASLMQGGVSSSQAASAMAGVMDAKTLKYTISMVTVIPILEV